ncbi:MAG: Fpg/Nei family DNA glycosylase [Oligoflexia bacterium]|nr:Fpg/Nei family DNA glycosylase [Oligoflexia bacterium]
MPPELAEVETIRSQLNKALPLKVKDVFLSNHAGGFVKKALGCNIVTNIANITNITNIIGSTITKIDRHGKYLIFKFNNDDNVALLSHLGMSGHWQINNNKNNNNSLLLPTKHIHLSLKGSKVSFDYIDPRRFGMFALMDKNTLNDKLSLLGPDLTSKKLNNHHIKQALERYPNRSLKKLLLDQSLFAGMGNYLANEVCAHSKILPMRIAKDVSKIEISKINYSIKKVVSLALKSKGTTLSKGGYKNADGEYGTGISNLVVFYQKICGMCGKCEVIKDYMDGRGTYYCPKCQQ